MCDEQWHVLLGVILLERRRVLWLVVQHDDRPLHSGWGSGGGGGGGLLLGCRAGSRHEGGKRDAEERTHVGLLIEGHVSSNDARSTSGFTCPAWYVFPLWTLVSQTSAGLNSSGSIL